jgi:hypothetical protein
MGGILHSFQISEVRKGGAGKISDPAENMVLGGQPVTSYIIDSGNLDSSSRNSSSTQTYLLTELSPSLEAANCAVIQEIPSNFKEPEGSSLCSQEPSTGPYPEPV